MYTISVRQLRASDVQTNTSEPSSLKRELSSAHSSHSNIFVEQESFQTPTTLSSKDEEESLRSGMSEDQKGGASGITATTVWV